MAIAQDTALDILIDEMRWPTTTEHRWLSTWKAAQRLMKDTGRTDAAAVWTDVGRARGWLAAGDEMPPESSS